VIAQADGPFRETVEDIGKLRTRNDRGEMVPIGSMVTIKQTFGPDPVLRFNGYPAADLAGEADPRLLSSAEAMNKLTEIAGKVLPVGMTTEWTDLSYQQATQARRPSSCSRWRSCWPSWCWPRCTRAGRCRWR
jgi:multidrug efflux pump